MSAFTIYADLVGKIDFLVYNAGVDAVQRADIIRGNFFLKRSLPTERKPSQVAVVFAEEARVRRLFC